MSSTVHIHHYQDHSISVREREREREREKRERERHILPHAYNIICKIWIPLICRMYDCCTHKLYSNVAKQLT